MERRLAAILSCDVVGYSRLMGRDEAWTLASLKTLRREVLDTHAERHHGRTIKLMGDGALMEFASAVDAMRFAVAVQCAMRGRNSRAPETQRIDFRIGINIGDVIVEGDDIYGDGVNVAARLEGLAEPGGICIHQSVRDQVRDKLALDFQDRGEIEVKNIERPVHAFDILMNDRAEVVAAAPVDARTPAPRKPRLVQAAGAIALLLALVAGMVWWHPWAPESGPAKPESIVLPLPAKPSIAVLAFENLSGDPAQEFLSDAVSDSIITELSRFPELFVIARNSSFKYKGEATDIREIGRELGVRYVVEGGMQRADDRLRVNVQLIEADSGRHVWAESFDRRNEDIFAVQDAIVEAIVTILSVKLEDAERQRVSSKVTSSLDAYDLFLRARDLQLRKGFWVKEVNQEARTLLERAVALDPKFSRAYADLAWTYLLDFLFGWAQAPEVARDRGHMLAQKAVELDPSSARAHHALGFAHLYRKEHDLAMAETERAIALNPNDAGQRAGSASLNIYGGNPEIAIEQITEAMRLNPYHPDFYWHLLGWARFHAGEYEEGLAAMKRIVDPGAADHRVMAALNARLGRLDEAAGHAREVLKREPDFAISHFRRNLPYRHESDAEDYAAALALAGLPEEPPLALPDKPSIAVLAFDNLSGDPGQEFLSDAISDTIITELSRFAELFVIARNSTFKYKGTATDVRDIGRELGARYVVEGSMQRADDRLRVTVQLIDAVSGNHVWAETFDRKLDDIFAVQDEISRAIVTTLAENLKHREADVARAKPAKNLKAYELDLLARAAFRKFTREGSDESGRLAEQAIAFDPNSSDAYESLAWVYINGFRWGWSDTHSPEESLDLAFKAARKAIELDPFNYRAYWVLANATMQSGDLEGALEHYNKTLEINPNAASVFADTAELMVFLGHTDEAVARMETAIRLNPRGPNWYLWNLGWAQYHAGDCAGAVATFRKMPRIPPLANRSLAASHACLGQLDEARAAIDALLEHDPEYSITKWRLHYEHRYRDRAVMDRHIADLRAAGLPE